MNESLIYISKHSGAQCFQFLKNSGDIEDTNQNFTVGVARCASQGAQIASIHSVNQNAWIIRHLVSQGKKYYLGMSGIYGIMKDIWNDGSKLDFINMAPDQPRQDFDPDGDCLKIQSADSDNGKYPDGSWLTGSCTQEIRPICQKPAIKGRVFNLKFYF